MYPVSQEYSQAIMENNRNTKISGTIKLKDNSTITLIDSDVQQGSLSLNRKCLDKAEFSLGSVNASELSISIITTDDKNRFNDSVIEIRFGIETAPNIWEYVPLGIYNTIECSRSGRCVTIKALDNMIKFDKADIKYNSKTASLYEFTTYACGLSGVTFAMTQSEFVALPNTNKSFQLLSNSPVETPRDLLGYVAELLGCFAYINRDGKLSYKRFNNAPVAEIKGSARYNTSVMDFATKINGVKMVLNNFDYIRVDSSITDGTTLVLSTNPLLQPPTTESTINEVLDNILIATKMVTYMPFTCDCTGNPALDVGDYITLSGGKINGSVIGLITSSNWKYRGKQQLKGEGKDPKLLVRETQSKKQENSLLETFKVETNNAIELLVRGVDDNTTQLRLQQGEILLKVDANGIISAINMSREGIKIQGDKIDIDGFVTFSDLTDGVTTISGDNITTGTIIAEVINASVSRLKYLTVGGEDPFRVFPNGIRYADGSFAITEGDGEGGSMMQIGTTGKKLTIGAGYQVVENDIDNPTFMVIGAPSIVITKEFIQFNKPTSDVWTGTQAEYDALSNKNTIKLAVIK